MTTADRLRLPRVQRGRDGSHPRPGHDVFAAFVAQKKGWLGDLEVEDVHVTGDANAMRVLLSGNADTGLIGTRIPPW